MTPAIEHTLPIEEPKETPPSGVSRLPEVNPYLLALGKLADAQEAYIRWEITPDEFAAAEKQAHALYLEWVEDCRKRAKEKA